MATVPVLRGHTGWRQAHGRQAVGVRARGKCQCRILNRNPERWTKHPEFKERTIWEVFQDERASLMELRGPFDRFVEKAVRASTTCLIMADHNRYSVDARAAGRMVLVRSHAERIVVLLGNEVVADHPRQFRRDQIIYDPWHYLPVLMKKPGALRNGAPFKDWALPPALTQVRAKLKSHADGDRQFVKVLGAVLDHGLAGATEDEIAAEQVAARAQKVRSFERKRPSQTIPAHLPRERVLIPAPECCPCCGAAQLSKLGEDMTETLEVIPRRWKMIQTVREKFSCRACETITQPPAPFHVTPRGFAGPNLLAMILFEKFGQHQPLNPSERTLPTRRHRSERLDACRPGRRLHGRPEAAARAD